MITLQILYLFRLSLPAPPHLLFEILRLFSSVTALQDGITLLDHEAWMIDIQY